MRLTMFHAGKGDCLLLASGDGSTRILVDGGMPKPYTDHVASALGRLRAAGHGLDLVYVSHIDQDHIGGVLRLLDDEVAWRVHEYQRAHGNPAHKAPSAPRPPAVAAIWHNAFHDQLEKNAGPVEDSLAAMAPVLAGSALPALRAAGRHQTDLAASIREAIQVSRRIGAGQLAVPLNQEAGGKLMMRRPAATPIRLGPFTCTVLGPSPADLTRLRRDWNTWVEKNAQAIVAMRARARQDEDRLKADDVLRLMRALALDAEALGDPSSVTPPNLASLTLLVREGARSLLLTGDARGDQILDGLEATAEMPAGGHLHVDVLKVQHHGSKNNIDRDFCDRVTADHYVFCGNGEHHNPHLAVVELVAARRFAAGGPRFKYWFNASEAVVPHAGPASHMADVERLVRRLVTRGKGQMQSRFLKSGSSLRVI